MSVKSIVFSLGLAALLALTSCDYITGPVTEGVTNPTGEDSVRKVLLEEFSGHRCQNCPPSHRESQKLDSIYGENLIIVTVHASGFAAPAPTLGFPDDYRTPFGDALELEYNAALTIGYPAGMINRAEFNSSRTHKYTTWGQYASKILEDTATLSMDLAVTYNPSNRNADITVDMDYLLDAPDNHQLMVIITEDSLVSPQLDGFSTINDYVHRHVLRDNITSGYWGLPVSGTAISAGENFQQNFSYTLDTAWSDKHCSIIAFVLDGDTYEVYQAAETHIDYQ